MPVAISIDREAWLAMVVLEDGLVAPRLVLVGDDIVLGKSNLETFIEDSNFPLCVT